MYVLRELLVGVFVYYNGRGVTGIIKFAKVYDDFYDAIADLRDLLQDGDWKVVDLDQAKKEDADMRKHKRKLFTAGNLYQ
jgi:predicted RNA-binding protein with RPS1 domain